MNRISIETHQEQTQMLALAEKENKSYNYIPHVGIKLRHGKYKKKTKIEFLEIELKTIMSEMKNSAAGIRHRRFEIETSLQEYF